VPVAPLDYVVSGVKYVGFQGNGAINDFLVQAGAIAVPYESDEKLIARGGRRVGYAPRDGCSGIPSTPTCGQTTGQRRSSRTRTPGSGRSVTYGVGVIR
jgi:hypothetical protein